MKGLIQKSLFAESVTAGGSINKALDMIPSDVAGEPAYVAGILLSYYGTLTSQAGTEDASQRQLANSLGSVQLQGGGINLARQAISGEELLLAQYMLGLGTAYTADGGHGVIHDASNIAADGQTAEHHVLLPFAPRCFQAGRLGNSKPFDGAMDAALFRASTNLTLNQVGTAPVTDVAWSNLTVKASVFLVAGNERISPLDSRLVPLGVINEDPKPFSLGQMSDLTSMCVYSEAVPASNDSDPLAIKTSAAEFEVELGGLEVLSVYGAEIQAGSVAQGLSDVMTPRADEESSMQLLYSSYPMPQASHRPAGDRLILKGWNNETETSKAMVFVVSQPDPSLLRRWAQLRGLSLDRGVVSKSNVGKGQNLDKAAATGVPVEFVQP